MKMAEKIHAIVIPLDDFCDDVKKIFGPSAMCVIDYGNLSIKYNGMHQEGNTLERIAAFYGVKKVFTLHTDSAQDDALPTTVWMAYNTDAEENYIVCIDSHYIRDAQLYAPDGGWEDCDYSDDANWVDTEPNAYVGKCKAASEEEACVIVGKLMRYDPRCLYAIKI